MESYNRKFRGGDRAVVVRSKHQGRVGQIVTILAYTGHGNEVRVKYGDFSIPHFVTGMESSYELLTTLKGTISSKYTNELFLVDEKILVKAKNYIVKCGDTVNLEGYYIKTIFVVVGES